VKRRRGLTLIRQRHDMDCGVAALAMFLSVPYGDMAAVTRARFGSLSPERRGLGLHHLEELATFYDRPLRRIYKAHDYLVGRTGVIGVIGGDMTWCGHWVVLKDGTTVVDPAAHGDADVWNVADYLQRNHCRLATLLVDAEIRSHAKSVVRCPSERNR
jgi:hypothetical protein